MDKDNAFDVPAEWLNFCLFKCSLLREMCSIIGKIRFVHNPLAQAAKYSNKFTLAKQE